MGLLFFHALFSLTMDGVSREDPYVDSNGWLDFSVATSEDTDFYRCTAIDELGVTVVQTIYVEVTHNSEAT